MKCIPATGIPFGPIYSSEVQPGHGSKQQHGLCLPRKVGLGLNIFFFFLSGEASTMSFELRPFIAPSCHLGQGGNITKGRQQDEWKLYFQMLKNSECRASQPYKVSSCRFLFITCSIWKTACVIHRALNTAVLSPLLASDVEGTSSVCMRCTGL